MKKPIKIVIKKFSDAVALLTAELLLVFISFFISLSVLIIVVRQIFFHKEYTTDERVFSYLSQHVTDTNTSVMQFFSLIGSGLFLVPAFLVMLTFYYFIRKHKWYFIKIIIIALSNYGLMVGLKILFNRSRPLIPLLKQVPGLSFPSGHAFMNLTFYGLIIYIVYHEVKNKWVKWITIFILALVTFLVGLSRVYLRAHYASDVIAGFCFGVLSLVILLWMLRWIEKFNAKKIPSDLNVTKAEEDIRVVKAG